MAPCQSFSDTAALRAAVKMSCQEPHILISSVQKNELEERDATASAVPETRKVWEINGSIF